MPQCSSCQRSEQRLRSVRLHRPHPGQGELYNQLETRCGTQCHSGPIECCCSHEPVIWSILRLPTPPKAPETLGPKHSRNGPCLIHCELMCVAQVRNLGAAHLHKTTMILRTSCTAEQTACVQPLLAINAALVAPSTCTLKQGLASMGPWSKVWLHPNNPWVPVGVTPAYQTLHPTPHLHNLLAKQWHTTQFKKWAELQQQPPPVPYTQACAASNGSSDTACSSSVPPCRHHTCSCSLKPGRSLMALTG